MPVPRLGRGAFLRLCAANFLYFAAIGVGMPVLPHYVLGPAGGTKLGLGVAIAAFSVTALLLRPLVVPVARRFSPARVMAAGAVVAGLAEGLLVLGPPPSLIVALRAVAGAGEAFYFVLASAAVYDLVPKERHGEAVSYFSAALSAGLLGSPVLGVLLREHAGYDAVWLTGLALCLLAAALSATLRLPPLPAPQRRGVRLVHPAALRPGLLLAANTWGPSAFSTFTALYVTHLGLGAGAPEFAVFAIVLLLGRVLGARWLDRVHPRVVGLAALSLQAVALVLFALARSSPALLLCSALLAAGTALAYPAIMSLAIRAAPDHERTEVVATATACFDAGYAVSALVLSAALQMSGFSAVYGCAAFVVALGALALARSLRRPAAAT